MRPIVLIVLIAAAHIAFLYGAYGSKFFDLPLSYNAALALWLGTSTIAAGFGYSKEAAGLVWFSNGAHRRHLFAVAMAALSLFAGVFWAFNTFGT